MGAEDESGAEKLGTTHPRSKFLKAVSDRQREVHDWAREGRPVIEYARHLGQMTENVTLDMMLQEHLHELSRARYKFKVNNRYEKKMFLQRQMKKSSAMREKLKDVDFEDRRPKWAQTPPTTMQHRQKAPTSPEKNVRIRETSRTPSRMLHSSPQTTSVRKPDSAPPRRAVFVTETPRAQTRTTFYETSTASPRNGGRSSVMEGKSLFFQTELQPEVKTRKTPTPVQGMMVTGGSSHVNPPTSTPRKTPNKPSDVIQPPRTAPERTFAASFEQPVTSSSATVTKARRLSKEAAVAARKAHLQSWAETNRAVNDKRFVKDQRYAKLEQSLSQPYRGKPETPSVPDIIASMHVLGMPERSRSNGYRKPISKRARDLFGLSPTLPLKAY